MRKLIESISKHPELIQRKDYVAKYPEFLQDMGDRDFDKFAAGGDYPDVEVLSAILELVLFESGPILVVGDKLLAHRDEVPPPDATYEDLNKAFEAIGMLYRYLSLLITGSAPTELVPVRQYDWEWIFYEPWMRPKEEDPVP